MLKYDEKEGLQVGSNNISSEKDRSRIFLIYFILTSIPLPKVELILIFLLSSAIKSDQRSVKFLKQGQKLTLTFQSENLTLIG